MLDAVDVAISLQPVMDDSLEDENLKFAKNYCRGLKRHGFES